MMTSPTTPLYPSLRGSSGLLTIVLSTEDKPKEIPLLSVLLVPRWEEEYLEDHSIKGQNTFLSELHSWNFQPNIAGNGGQGIFWLLKRFFWYNAIYSLF